MSIKESTEIMNDESSLRSCLRNHIADSREQGVRIYLVGSEERVMSSSGLHLQQYYTTRDVRCGRYACIT